MIERAVSFGAEGRLVGVLTEPAPAVLVSGAPALLLWNVGMNHHAGPYRFNVDLARALALRGFSSLRFDISGLGDSDVRRDALRQMDRALDDLREAKALVAARTQITRFVPLGFCSSTDAAHELALRDPDIAGACFVEGYSYRTAGFYLRFPRRLLDRERWVRWAAHRVPVRLRSVFGVDEVLGNSLVGAEARGVYVREYPSREQLRRDYELLANRGVRMLFYYVGGASSFNSEAQFFEMLRSNALRGRVRVEYDPAADHTFFRVPDRARAVTRICDWMDLEFGAHASPPAPHAPRGKRMGGAWSAFLTGSAAAALTLACHNGSTPGGPTGSGPASASDSAPTSAVVTTSADIGPTATPATMDAAEWVYDAGRKGEWQDWGWSTHDDVPNGPARVDMSSWGGWLLARPDLSGDFGGLAFRAKAPASFGDFLDVFLESATNHKFPHVKPRTWEGRDVGDGFREYYLPMKALNPEGMPFDRMTFFVRKKVPHDLVSFDKIRLTKAPDPSTLPPPPVRDQAMAVDCRAKTTRINPLIYGIAFDAMHDAKDKQQWEMGSTARRWGGNSTSRYNWQLGNAWSTANDWYFQNVNYTEVADYSYTRFLADNATHGMKTALTVPMVGWVAKDTTSYSFPVSVYGLQERVDEWKNDSGNGKSKSGKNLTPGPATRTSIPAPPEFIRRWVETIRKADQRTGTRSVHQYILDNEPNLWNSTHRDVHPDPLTYDELVSRTIAYGSAIRAADPDAVIAGPAEWGWTNYFFSAKDAVAGFGLKPDQRAHGNTPLVAYYLKKLAEHERTTGTRVLDVFDLHFYPQGERLYGQTGGTDAQTAARRIRATRALWDPSYVDESWIKEPVRLLPRMKEWVAQNYPGRGISIGEWNYGGEGHISGALAVAETLGRYAQAEVASAFYWSYPAANSPVFWAFRAYTNFDGRGARFQDNFVPASVASSSSTSVFASRDDASMRFVLVVLNLATDAIARATISLSGCAAPSGATSWVYAGGPAGLVSGKAPKVDAHAVVAELPPSSITVLDLRMPGAR